MLDGIKRVAMEIAYPADFKLAEINNRVVGALGVTFGATHTEYIIAKDGVYFIESANRGGGCLTSSLIVPAVSGFDVSEGLIKLALGQSVEVAKTKSGAAVLRFFRLRPGRMNKIDITDNENILAFQMLHSEGEIIEPITNAANRHGFVITKGKTIEEARGLSEYIRGCVEC
jgi:biotin carboxylase